MTIKKGNAKGSKFVDKMRETKKRLKSGIEIMTIGGDETVKRRKNGKGN